jgi:hypothetical protein
MNWAGLAAEVVWVLHALLVAWIVATPFFGGDIALVVHLVVLAAIMAHWALNSSQCVLGELEKWLRGVDDGHSFFYSLVAPVYRANESELGGLVWLAAIALWLTTLSKVMKRPAMLREVLWP